MPDRRIHAFRGVDTEREPYLRDPREALPLDDARNLWARKGALETRPGVERFIPTGYGPEVLVPQDPEVFPDPSDDFPYVNPPGDPPPSPSFPFSTSPSVNPSGSTTPSGSSGPPSGSSGPPSGSSGPPSGSGSGSQIPCAPGSLRVTFSGLTACTCYLGRGQIMDPDKMNRQWCAPVSIPDPGTGVTTWQIPSNNFTQFNVTIWDDTPPYCSVNPQPLSHTHDLVVQRDNSNPLDVRWTILASGDFGPDLGTLGTFSLVNAAGGNFNEGGGANEAATCPNNLLAGGSVSVEVAT